MSAVTKEQRNVDISTGPSIAPNTAMPGKNNASSTTNNIGGVALPYARLFSKTMSISGMSEAGRNFIDILTRRLTTVNPKEYDMDQLSISVERVPAEIESIACIDNGTKNTIILMFAETYTGGNINPVSNYIPEIMSAFRAKRPGYNILQVDIVDTLDYKRVENWCKFIFNCFCVSSPANRMTAETFMSMRIQTSTDLSRVKAFINKYSPHEVQDRCDWGVIIDWVTDRDRATGYNMDKTPSSTSIIAVGGYTKFYPRNVNGRIRFLPVCIITNITTIIPSMDVLSLVIPITAGCIIAQRHWERPYMSFAAKSPNLGCLIANMDASGTKKVGFFKNYNEMRAGMAMYMDEVPMLGIDFAEGRASLVKMDDFIGHPNEVKEKLLSRFDAFFSGYINSFNKETEKHNTFRMPSFRESVSNPVAFNFMNYEGKYKTNVGNLGLIDADTRYFDYINVASGVSNPEQYVDLLNQRALPFNHIQDIAKIYGDEIVTSMYRVYTSILDGQMVNVMTSYISNILRCQYETNMAQDIDVASMINCNTTIGGNYPLYNGYNPGMSIINYY